MTLTTSRRLVAALAVVAAACGRAVDDAPTAPSAPLGPSAPPSGPGSMALLARLDIATLEASPRLGPEVNRGATAPMSLAGCWGYTSPGGRRFALTGTSLGLSIVEVTDPARPVNIGIVPGADDRWREVKTYKTFAYVSTEAPEYGLDVVDLSDPDRPRKVQTWGGPAGQAHTLCIDAGRGLLFLNGNRYGTSPTDTGPERVLSLEPDPAQPRQVGTFGSLQDYQRTYLHDCYAAGDRLYGAAIYDGAVSILDARDPARVTEITRFPTGGRFTHNVWPTRDGRYVFTTDERSDQPVEGWDLSDPIAPRKVAQYLGAPGSIAHNVMIDGDRLLIAHYTEGVHLLDVANPERPALLSSYDTYPGSERGFHGAWGAYIFPGTNIVIASDIEGGLFVLRHEPR
jgi:choice-of-anchor B domain-containing protein